MSQVMINGNQIAGTVAAIHSGEYNLFKGFTPTALTLGNGTSLSWESGVLTYTGDNMDESAKLFLEFLKPYVDNYIRSKMPHDNLKYLEWCANEGKNVE